MIAIAIRRMGLAALALSLAACKPESPTVPKQTGLLGAWSPAPITFVAPGPDGQPHTYQIVETWRLGAGNTFYREAWFFEPAAGKVYVDYQDQGTFTAHDGVLALSVVTEVHATLDQFVTAPERRLAPPGKVLYYRYTLEGDVLSVAPSCAPGVECPQPQPVAFHRTPLLID
jgi:hypothetical protein